MILTTFGCLKLGEDRPLAAGVRSSFALADSLSLCLLRGLTLPALSVRPFSEGRISRARTRGQSVREVAALGILYPRQMVWGETRSAGAKTPRSPRRLRILSHSLDKASFNFYYQLPHAFCRERVSNLSYR
jgi:hypothetical protein